MQCAVEREQPRLSYKILSALAACGLMASAATAGAQAITVGATSSTSDAPIYIADKLGISKETVRRWTKRSPEVELAPPANPSTPDGMAGG